MDSRDDRDAGRRSDVPGLRRSRDPALARRTPRRRGAGVSGAGRDGAPDLLDMRPLRRRSWLECEWGDRVTRHAAAGGIGAYGAAPVRNTLGASGFAAADRRQVAAQAGLAGATAADRATRGLRDDRGGPRHRAATSSQTSTCRGSGSSPAVRASGSRSSTPASRGTAGCPMWCPEVTTSPPATAPRIATHTAPW